MVVPVIVIVVKLVEEIPLTQTIVPAVIVAVSLIFIIISLFIIVIIRPSTILVDLDFAAFQCTQCAVTVRELQTEAVPVRAIINNNYCIGDSVFAVDFGSAFDLSRNRIDCRVGSNFSTFDFHSFVVIE